ncbi:MAG: hypothetical protein H6711_14225 [Myxococcales bacterium]|nr:hypothetical protein [Myxococcales bacterium]
MPVLMLSVLYGCRGAGPVKPMDEAAVPERGGRDPIGLIPTGTEILVDIDPREHDGQSDEGLAPIVGLLAVTQLEDAYSTYGVALRCGLPNLTIERVTIAFEDSSWGAIVGEPGVGDARWFACAAANSSHITALGPGIIGVEFEGLAMVALHNDQVALGRRPWVESVVVRARKQEDSSERERHVLARTRPLEVGEAWLRVAFMIRSGVDDAPAEWVTLFWGNADENGDSLEVIVEMSSFARAVSFASMATGVIKDVYDSALDEGVMPPRVLDTLVPSSQVVDNRVVYRMKISEDAWSYLGRHLQGMMKEVVSGSMDLAREDEVFGAH